MSNPALAVLFSDIEGSTQRWERDPAAMNAALARHDELMRSAFDQPGVWVLKHTGDGMVVAAADPEGLLAAALDAQRRLRAADWAAVGGLQVRMGLHCGQFFEREGDLFGPDMNLAARIADGANGGQIVLSDRTLHALNLPADCTSTPLGRFRFRGVVEPVPVFGLRFEGDSGPYPPFRSKSAVSGNLPRGAAGLVGRDDLVAEVRRRVDEPGLVTLVGTGGVGKTTLALAVADGVAHVFPDGRWYVDLAAIGSDVEVVSAVAASVDLGEHNGRSTEKALVDLFAQRSMLVILDNCEHVLEGVRGLLDATLLSDAAVTVLATSQTPLAHRAERLVTVEALGADGAESAAVALFIDRARLHHRDYHPGASELRLVVELCQRLDGLPLAIELAASRTATLSVGEMCALLDHRFSLLKGRGTTRHDALERTISWSYDLLGADEAGLLRAITIFDGPFDLGEAATVSGIDVISTADLIGALLSKSMVVPVATAQRRFRLLESIRLFAAARLDELGEREVASGRLTNSIVAGVARMGADIDGPSQLECFERLDSVAASLKAVVAWLTSSRPVDALHLLVQTYPYWMARGGRTDVVRWINTAVSNAGSSIEPGLLSRSLSDASTFAFYTGNPDSRALCQRSIAVSEQHGMPARPTALLRLAGFQVADGDVAAALQTCDVALENCRQPHDPPEIAAALGAVGAFISIAGDHERGIAVCQDAISSHPSCSPATATSDLLNLGFAYRQTHPDKSIEAFVAGQRQAVLAKAPLYEATAGLAAGMAMRSAGRDLDALRMLGGTLELTDQLRLDDDSRRIVRALAGLLRTLDSPAADQLRAIADESLAAVIVGGSSSLLDPTPEPMAPPVDVAAALRVIRRVLATLPG